MSFEFTFSSSSETNSAVPSVAIVAQEPVSETTGCCLMYLPSGNQTWFAGKSPIYRQNLHS